MTTFVELEKADARADKAERGLLEALSQLGYVCEDHVLCDACGEWACAECSREIPSLVPTSHACDEVEGRLDLCETCWDECGPCRDQAARETAAEQRADYELDRDHA